MKLNPLQVYQAVRRQIRERQADEELMTFGMRLQDIGHRAQVARRMATASVRCGTPVVEAQRWLDTVIDGLEQELKVLLA